MSTSNSDVLFEGPSNLQQRYREMGDESHAMVVLARNDLQRSFNSGFQFRTWHEFSIADGAYQAYKIVAGKNTVVTRFEVLLETDSVDFELLTGGTEGGTFNSSLTVLQTNRQSTVPTRTTSTTLTTGGTHTGGTVAEKFHVDATKHGNISVATSDQPYGFAAGTYYIRITQTGNQTADGYLRLLWEER